MRTIFNKIASIALAACMAATLLPASALAAPTSAGIGEVGSFTISEDGQSATASTDVSVNYVEDFYAFRIADQIDYADLNTADGIWVSLVNGEKPYGVEWYRMKAEVADDGSLVPPPELSTSLPGIERIGETVAGTAGQQVFKWEAAGDPYAQKGDVYYYWAIASDSAGSTATSRPITFLYEDGYREGPIFYPEPTDWTWSMGGQFNYDDVTYGGKGSFRVGTVLSAPELDKLGATWWALHDAAAGVGQAPAAPARVEGAWSVWATNKDYDDVFRGDMLMRIDVTDAVERLAGEGASPDKVQAVLDSLGLLWQNPYAPGGPEVQQVQRGSKAEDNAGEPWGLKVVADGDRYVALFYMPHTLAGEEGVLGSFALTSPVSRTDRFLSEIAAGEGGTIFPSGEKWFIEGTEYEFALTPVDEHHKPEYVEVTYLYEDGSEKTVRIDPTFAGEGHPEAGSLVGNVLTLAPIGSTADEQAKPVVGYRIHAAFEEEPAQVDPERFPAEIAVGQPEGSDPADTRVTFTQPGEQPLTLNGGQRGQADLRSDEGTMVSFDSVPNGYVPDTVTVTYTEGDLAGKTITYVVPEGTYRVQLDPLEGPTTIEVSFKEGMPKVAARHLLFAEVAAGQEAMGTASVNAPSVEVGGSATFSARPSSGYMVESVVAYTRSDKGSDWVRLAAYTPDQLAGGTSLTLRSITADTRVVFSFTERRITFIAPDDVEHAAVEVGGDAKPVPGKDGTYEVGPGDVVEITVRPEEGYKVAPGGITLLPADGSGAVPVSFTKNPDGSYTARIPYAEFESIGDGAQLTVKVVEDAGEDNPPIVVPPDQEIDEWDVNKKFWIRPDGPDRVVDSASIDDVKILDEEGVELKDRLTERDADGKWVSPDYPGVKYDPDTGEYTLPDGDRFTYNAIDGYVVFTHIAKGNKHHLYVVSADAVRVNVMARTDAEGNASGTLVPVGTFLWKKDRDLIAVAIPDTGAQLEAMFLDNNPAEVADAATEHVERARADVKRAQIWNNTADLEALARTEVVQTMGGLIARTAVLAAADMAANVAPEQLVAKGAKHTVVPASYFAGIPKGQTVELHAKFANPRTSGPFTVSASVREGKGVIDGAAEQTVERGADCTVAFKPEVGWHVAAVWVDGEREAWSQKSYTLTNVQASHKVEVEFAENGYSGDNSDANRVVRTLGSMAQTGDLNGPVMLALGILAAIAAAVAFVLFRRKRKERA